MANLKIVFSGPVGAGKTTAITTLSDEAPVSTNEAASDMTTKRKSNTTVAMDYGVMALDGHERIHLYGTPGQERFDFMWDILTQGGLGLILLLDNSRPDPLKDMCFFINTFKEYIANTAIAIGITQTDINPLPKLDIYNNKLREMNQTAAVFKVDAREHHDVSMLVQSLLFTLDPGLEY